MTTATTSDPFLAAITQGPSPLLLTEKDVAALLQCSTRLLQDWRAEGVKPPYWIFLGPKLVRYPAQALTAWIDSLGGAQQPKHSSVMTVVPAPTDPRIPEADGFNEPLFRGGRRRAPHTTFQSFLVDGLPGDEWLFVEREGKRPVDFLGSLTDERSDDDNVLWLRLDEFTVSLRRGAEHEDAAILRDSLAKRLSLGRDPQPSLRMGPTKAGEEPGAANS